MVQIIFAYWRAANVKYMSRSTVTQVLRQGIKEAKPYILVLLTQVSELTNAIIKNSINI